jgi:serine/threonine protein kinase
LLSSWYESIHPWPPHNPPAHPLRQIDLEESTDELADIQAEINLLGTCKSPYVTEYKTSFVRGVKLWIVMEFLGGGSALDLVRQTFETRAQ